MTFATAISCSLKLSDLTVLAKSSTAKNWWSRVTMANSDRIDVGIQQVCAVTVGVHPEVVNNE